MPNSKTDNKIVNNKDVAHLVSIEPIFKHIKDSYGLPPNWSRPEGFETLVQIILEQQVSLSSAKAHFVKLKSTISEITPENILKLDDVMMRENHISRQKASYLRALSHAVLDKELILEELSNLSEEKVREQLTNIKGIGNWTADVYLMSSLQSKNIFPIGDIALVNTMKEFTGLKDKETILNYADKWKPYRSLATYFLWHNYLKKRNRTFENM